MERARLIAGVTLVLIIAAALIFVIVRNAGEVDEPTTAGTSAPAEEEEPAPEPTPEADEEPLAVPTPDTTGRDFDHIFREIVAFRDWLFANPDPELVDVIYHPECECNDEVVEALAYLQDNSLHLDDEGTDVHDVETVDEFESLVQLRVELERTAQVVVDSDGNVVEETDGSDPRTYVVTLVKPGNRWYVRTIWGE